MRPFVLASVAIEPYFGSGFDSLTLTGTDGREVRVNLHPPYAARGQGQGRIPTTLQYEVAGAEALAAQIGRRVIDVYPSNSRETYRAVTEPARVWMCYKSVRIYFDDEGYVDVLWRASGFACTDANAVLVEGSDGSEEDT